jgi:hypothetical protein
VRKLLSLSSLYHKKGGRQEKYKKARPRGDCEAVFAWAVGFL